MIDVLLAPRLTLHLFSASDADEAYSCITPSLTRYMRWEPAANPDEFAKIWQTWIQNFADKKELVFTIREKKTNLFLGLVGLHDLRTSTPELGIWIREDCHSKGFGREAVTCLYAWASATFDYSRFVYPVAEDNHPSRRIAESLGGVVADIRSTPKYRSVLYYIPRHDSGMPLEILHSPNP